MSSHQYKNMNSQNTGTREGLHQVSEILFWLNLSQSQVCSSSLLSLVLFVQHEEVALKKVSYSEKVLLEYPLISFAGKAATSGNCKLISCPV